MLWDMGSSQPGIVVSALMGHFRRVSLITADAQPAASPMAPAQTPPPAAQQAVGPSPSLENQLDFHFQSDESQTVRTRIFLSDGFFLGGTNVSERFQLLEKAADSSVWQMSLSKVWREGSAALCYAR